MGLAYTNTRLSRRNSLAIPVAPSAAIERKPKALDGGATLYRAPILAAGLPLRPIYRKINLSLPMCGDRGQASRIEPPGRGGGMPEPEWNSTTTPEEGAIVCSPWTISANT
jgi:hypothetical protein